MSSQEELIRRQKELDAVREQGLKLSEDYKNISNKIAELQKQLDVLAQAKRHTSSVLEEKRSTYRKVKKEVADLERKVNREEFNETFVEIFQKEGKRLDKLTTSHPWRIGIHGNKAFPHQLEGAKQLAILKRGLLGDKRGLGKTLSSIIWADMLEVKKLLVLSPAETVNNFRNEIPKWTNGSRPVHLIASTAKGERDFILNVLRELDEFTLLVNYEAWRKDPTILNRLVGLKAEAIILDEAHHLKSTKTVAFQGVRDIIYPKEPTIKYVLPMTGTYILNKPEELFALLHLINREEFPSRAAFQRDFLTQNWNGKWHFAPGGERLLIQQLGPRLVVRDRDSAGITIPPQSIEIHELDFNPTDYPEQFKHYEILQKKSAMLLEEDKVVGIPSVISLITRLRQMVTYPKSIELKDPDTLKTIFKCNIEESIKIDKTVELAKELILGEGKRVIVFSQFKAPLHECARRCNEEGVKAVVLDGSTPPPTRRLIEQDFDATTVQEKPQWDIAFCNYKVAGESLNLNAATQVIIIDEEWNPGKNEQAYGRVDRIGQREPTTVHILRAVPSVDEWMTDLIQEKDNLLKGFNVAYSEISRLITQAIKED